MSTCTGVTNFQKTVRFFWPTLYTYSRPFTVLGTDTTNKTNRGGSKGGQGASAPVKSLAPSGPQSKINDASILLKYVVIASNVYI